MSHSKPAVAFAICLFLSVTSADAQYVRMSVASNGAQGNFSSVTPSISRDGRFVAFASVATNLVVGDQNDTAPDIYLHDRDTDADGVFDEPGAIATVKVSMFPGGTDIPGACDTPTISGDGRYVVFFTTQIDSSHAAGVRHLLRWRRSTGSTAPSVAESGTARSASSTSLAACLDPPSAGPAFVSVTTPCG